MTTPPLTQHQRPMSTGGVWPWVLAAALAVAGVMHLLLTADHFGESTLMGLGFVAATVAQLGLAGAVLVRPGRWVYAAAIATSAVLIVLFLYNVFIGLPFAGHETAAAPAGTAAESAAEHADASDHVHGEDAAAHGDGAEHEGHHADGLVLGAGEPVDAAGAATKGAEIVAIAVAAGLLMRERGRTP
jgi:hypothetical protein